MTMCARWVWQAWRHGTRAPANGSRKGSTRPHTTAARQPRVPRLAAVRRSTSAAAWRAISSSSSVGTTSTATGDAAAEITGPPAALRAGRPRMPSRSSPASERARTTGVVLADARGERDRVARRPAPPGRRPRTCGSGSSRRRARARPRASPAAIRRCTSRMSLSPASASRPEREFRTASISSVGQLRVRRTCSDQRRVDVARARAHHQPLERRQPHRGVDAAAGLDRGGAGAVAEVQHDAVDRLDARPSSRAASRETYACEVPWKP